MGQRPVLKEALDSGAIDFIIKPFEENKVIESEIFTVERYSYNKYFGIDY